MPTLCPICNKDDEIRRLSAIVSAGQSYGMFSGPRGDGGYTMLSGSTSTQLANILSPPLAPEYPKHSFFVTLTVFVMVISCLCLSYPGTALFFGWAPAWMGTFPSEVPIHLIGLMGLVPLSGVVGALLGGGLRFLRITRAKARYATEKPAWDRAMEKYQRLYFCFRDNIVFDPKTGGTCQPQALTKFLYSTR